MNWQARFRLYSMVKDAIYLQITRNNFDFKKFEILFFLSFKTNT